MDFVFLVSMFLKFMEHSHFSDVFFFIIIKKANVSSHSENNASFLLS